ncbi:hypothetical protein KKB55_18485 [Myxococcota bacterium]|nr:hypothetical protein [Myxococcota bacterium]MBU1899734.1 hypothetical protein [Myxococcota bacterium]
MSQEQRPEALSAEDRALIEAINAAYTPPRPRRGFEGEVMARVAARRRGLGLIDGPMWAVAAVITAALLVTLPSSSLEGDADAASPLAEAMIAAPPMAEAIIPEADADAEATWGDEISEEEAQMLPDDYQVLAQIWTVEDNDTRDEVIEADAQR